jgi:hypothetical protein
MNLKTRIQSIPAVFLLLGLNSAHAALINVAPNVYRDTATNLEWLDMSLTTTAVLGLTDPLDVSSTTTANEIMAAVASSDYVLNQGFRVAISAEVAELYTGSGGVLPFLNGDYIGSPNFAPELFNLGTTDYFDDGIPFGINYDTIMQTGLHAGATPASVVSSEFRLHILTSFDMQPNYINDGAGYSPDAAPDALYASYHYSIYDSVAHDTGVYLVRGTVVPLPPALWLLGSGLMALLRFRPKN